MKNIKYKIIFKIEENLNNKLKVCNRCIEVSMQKIKKVTAKEYMQPTEFIRMNQNNPEIELRRSDNYRFYK